MLVQSVYSFWPFVFVNSKNTMNAITIAIISIAILQNAICFGSSTDMKTAITCLTAFSSMLLPIALPIASDHLGVSFTITKSIIINLLTMLCLYISIDRFLTLQTLLLSISADNSSSSSSSIGILFVNWTLYVNWIAQSICGALAFTQCVSLAVLFSIFAITDVLCKYIFITSLNTAKNIINSCDNNCDNSDNSDIASNIISEVNRFFDGYLNSDANLKNLNILKNLYKVFDTKTYNDQGTQYDQNTQNTRNQYNNQYNNHECNDMFKCVHTNDYILEWQ